MGRVLIGAVVFGVVTAGITAATLPWAVRINISYHAQASGGGNATADLSPVVGRMASILIGCAGAVIGAIAGATSARPESKPVPAWLCWTLVVGLIGVVLLAGSLFVARWPRPGPRGILEGCPFVGRLIEFKQAR